jgi:HAD superfamily hydrolase (TIGR01509 family)
VITWKSHRLRAVLFDMDGVIADTRLAHMRTWAIFAERHGIELDAEDWILRSFGRGNREILGELFPGRTLSIADLDELAEAKEAEFCALFRRGEVPAVEGLVESIARMRAAGLTLAVGSSAPPGNIATVLDTLGIAGEFATIVSSADVARAKPAPDIFLRCCELIGVPPGEALVLEDSLHGLEAARRAGSPAVGFATMHPAEELKPHAAGVVKDFVELDRLLFG